MIIAGKEEKERLRDVISMLRNTSNPQVEYIIRIIEKWRKDNGIKFKFSNSQDNF
jgi:intraflagellar transport protein 56